MKKVRQQAITGSDSLIARTHSGHRGGDLSAPGRSGVGVGVLGGGGGGGRADKAVRKACTETGTGGGLVKGQDDVSASPAKVFRAAAL